MKRCPYLIAVAVIGGFAPMMSQAATPVTQQKIDRLQHKIDSLKRQLHKIAAQHEAGQATESVPTPTPSKQHPPRQKLIINGGLETTYQIPDADVADTPAGGDYYLTDAIIGASGRLGNFTFDTSYFFLSGATQFLEQGEASYRFGANSPQRITGGFFQVPFGNLPYGYQSFNGNLGYEIGFTDHQAAGVGYIYQSGPWRLDIDAFKNHDLGQAATYGATPTRGYSQINGGNARIAYTFNQGTNHSAVVSVAGQGGQIEVGGAGGRDGSRWAATAAIDASRGPWQLQAQYVDYRYRIAPGQRYRGYALPASSVTFQDYGGLYQVPASGQLFTASAGRNFLVDWGPVTAVKFYDDYGYLKVGGSGRYDSTVPGRGPPNATGDAQFNIVGMSLQTAPVYLWFELLSSHDAGMSFVGPSDGDWHHSVLLDAAFYFSASVTQP